MSEWTSVNDRLPSPPEYAEVLVTDGWRCWSAYCGIFGDWWTAYKNSDNPITHWQPMPELPKPAIFWQGPSGTTGVVNELRWSGGGSKIERIDLPGMSDKEASCLVACLNKIWPRR